MSEKRVCVQCGKQFVLSDSEVSFYQSKNLSLPKRCKTCREMNKAKKTNQSFEYKNYTVKRHVNNRNSFILKIFVASALFLAAIFNLEFIPNSSAVIVCAVSALAILFLLLFGRHVYIEEFDTSPYKYTFYDTNSMVSHYVKHGEQVSCKSMEDYLLKANLVILNPSSLKRIQKDGDTAYFCNKTGEFVVVAKAGYIRTYFKADMRYFNKQ
ncbi:MAG: zinc-ribbon domain containing protein [Oscillospiraceae bacterium]|nr:zinc-ribbon domain containing protein [Oscillospiraceae bacterium]